MAVSDEADRQRVYAISAAYLRRSTVLLHNRLLHDRGHPSRAGSRPQVEIGIHRTFGCFGSPQAIGCSPVDLAYQRARRTLQLTTRCPLSASMCQLEKNSPMQITCLFAAPGPTVFFPAVLACSCVIVHLNKDREHFFLNIV
jgi:hypothetical protein